MLSCPCTPLKTLLKTEFWWGPELPSYNPTGLPLGSMKPSGLPRKDCFFWDVPHVPPLLMLAQMMSLEQDRTVPAIWSWGYELNIRKYVVSTGEDEKGPAGGEEKLQAHSFEESKAGYSWRVHLCIPQPVLAASAAAWGHFFSGFGILGRPHLELVGLRGQQLSLAHLWLHGEEYASGFSGLWDILPSQCTCFFCCTLCPSW